MLGLAAVSGCGRSAPTDALSNLNDDPDIAGVSITSPDAVIPVEPTTAVETVPDTTDTVSPQSQAAYTVQPGDTLSGIADTFGITIDELAQANGITDVNSIAPGQQLVIPAQIVEVTVVDAAETTTTAQP